MSLQNCINILKNLDLYSEDNLAKLNKIQEEDFGSLEEILVEMQKASLLNQANFELLMQNSLVPKVLDCYSGSFNNLNQLSLLNQSGFIFLITFCFDAETVSTCFIELNKASLLTQQNMDQICDKLYAGAELEDFADLLELMNECNLLNQSLLDKIFINIENADSILSLINYLKPDELNLWYIENIIKIIDTNHSKDFYYYMSTNLTYIYRNHITFNQASFNDLVAYLDQNLKLDGQLDENDVFLVFKKEAQSSLTASAEMKTDMIAPKPIRVICSNNRLFRSPSPVEMKNNEDDSEKMEIDESDLSLSRLQL